MPARRLKRKSYLSGKKGSKNKKAFVFFVIFILFFAPIYKIYASRKFWTGEDKISVVVQEKEGDVAIVIFDPVAEEITKIRIPADTQVEVAGDLGVWKLKSVWDLGKNEGLYGSLLTRTIAKNFKFPVFIWSENRVLGYLSTNPLEVIKATFSPYKTNLKLGDRVAIALFVTSVKNANRVEIDLARSIILKESILSDGVKGYVVSNLESAELLSKFADYSIADNNFSVVIKDATGKVGISERVGETIEVLGGKIVSISKVADLDFSCEVRSEDSKIAAKVAFIYGCEVKELTNEGNFDLEISLGNKFVQDY